jgi:polar amino acid transport system permease protein
MDSLTGLARELLPALLRGAVVTLELTAVSAVLALAAAFLAGFCRLSKSRLLRAVTTIYVEIFRGTSVLVQLFWFFFALPFLGVRLQPFTAGVLALGLNVGAYASEVVRGAILSVPKEQTEATIALNLTSWQRMRDVILPQAWVVMLPAFGNNIVELLKVTALVSLVTLQDVTFQAQIFTQGRGHTTEVFAVLLVVYFALAWPFTALVRLVERRSRWLGYGEARR